MTIAVTDIGIELYAKIGSATFFTKLLDVTSVPATGSMPQKLEGTVLSSPDEQFVKGRTTRPDMEFNYNFTEANLALALGAVTGDVEEFLIIYNEGNGTLIKGEADTWVDAVARNSVPQGKLSITPQDVDYVSKAQVDVLIDDDGFSTITFVIDDGADPIEDAIIFFNGQLKTTDVLGKAIFTYVPNDDVAYTIAKDGFVTQSDDLTVTEDSTEEFTLIAVA